jgi:hypothetical protein
MFGFQWERSGAALKSIYSKYLDFSRSKKQPDASALVDVSALFSFLTFILIWLSNQTTNIMSLFYSTLQPNKKIERFYFDCQTQNEIGLFIETGMESLYSN